MRYTRPLLSGALFAGALASCGDGTRPSLAPPDASLPPENEGGLVSPDTSPRDAGTFDVSPPPIVCADSKCATSLATVSLDTRSQTFCALLYDRTVACWGANEVGQLGRGDEGGTVDSATPERVVGLADVVRLDRTCAIDQEGAVYCWGLGRYLRSPDDVATTERTPVRLDIGPAKQVSVDFDVGCAVIGDGVVCWGRNTNGQVTPSGSFVPGVHAVSLPSGAKVRDLAVGKATLAVLEDGTLLSWGATIPLGRVSSLAPDPVPRPIAIGTVVAPVDVQRENACVIASGIGYCWGAGVPNLRSVDLRRALPAPTSMPEPIRQISTTPQFITYGASGPEALLDRWCATGVSGAVYCQGLNESGQAGDGTRVHATEAVKVKGLPAPAVEVKVSYDSTCALLANGKIYCWGSNYYGQLGSGRFRVASVLPQEVLIP